MTDMKRLLDSSRNPRAVALLEAGLHDEPGAHAAARAAVALGVAGTVTAASGVSAAAVLSNAPIATGSGGSGVVASLVAKWLLVGALSGVAATGAVVTLAPDPEPPAANRATASNRRVPDRRDAVVEPPAPELAGTNPVREAAPASAIGGEEPMPAHPSRNPRGQDARARDPRTTRDPAGATDTSPAPRSSTAALPDDPSRLGAEVRSIDAARRALAAGDWRHALAALDAYERARPTGVLDMEARLLRIEALASAGDRTGAARLAAAYLRDFPEDPHAVKLRGAFPGASP